MPIVLDGTDYGAPSENLKAAMKDAGLDSVDLGIGTGGCDCAPGGSDYQTEGLFTRALRRALLTVKRGLAARLLRCCAGTVSQFGRCETTEAWTIHGQVAPRQKRCRSYRE